MTKWTYCIFHVLTGWTERRTTGSLGPKGRASLRTISAEALSTLLDNLVVYSFLPPLTSLIDRKESVVLSIRLIVLSKCILSDNSELVLNEKKRNGRLTTFSPFDVREHACVLM